MCLISCSIWFWIWTDHWIRSGWCCFACSAGVIRLWSIVWLGRFIHSSINSCWSSFSSSRRSSRHAERLHPSNAGSMMLCSYNIIYFCQSRGYATKTLHRRSWLLLLREETHLKGQVPRRARRSSFSLPYKRTARVHTIHITFRSEYNLGHSAESSETTVTVADLKIEHADWWAIFFQL